MQLLFKEDIQKYLTFDNHKIRVADVPTGHPLSKFEEEGILKVKKIFDYFLEQVYKSVSKLAKDEKQMTEFGLKDLTVAWTPCKGR